MLLHTKKQYKSLPAKKKARLMDTNAVQHHEHLTEVDALWIKSVAATLYDTDDLD